MIKALIIDDMPLAIASLKANIEATRHFYYWNCYWGYGWCQAYKENCARPDISRYPHG